MGKPRVKVTAGAAVFYPLLFFLDTEGLYSVLLPGVLCHELGHLLSIWACGGRVWDVCLEVSGLRMETSPFQCSVQALACTAAGPAAGFLWAFFSRKLDTAWGIRSSAAAMVINGFNLLPALPLDGGELLFILTRSKAAVLACSWMTAVLLTAGFLRWRAWGLLVPAALIVRTVFSS